jgi:hypothetical protein
MSKDATPLHVDPARLPDDPAFLKQLIVQLFDVLREKDRQIAKHEHQLDLLLKKVYGRSSEKLDANQGLLFDVAPDGTAPDQAPPIAPAVPEPPAAPSCSKKAGHGRRRAPDTLQREVVVHDLTPAEKEALGGIEQLIELPDEVTEQVEWKPSSLFVTEHHRKKYVQQGLSGKTAKDDNAAMPDKTAKHDAAEQRETRVIVAPKPPEAIPGGWAGPGLLAQVIVSKAEDHLPLHRQERIFERQGLILPRQTTCDWWLACADLFSPLVELMRSETLASAVVHIDDTRVDIRDAHQKLQFQGHLWVRIGDEEHPCTVFDYTPDRTRAGPQQLLAGYRGYVQADAYSGYDGVYLGSNGAILEVACWAHARRKFHEARKLDGRAQVALARIGQLYALEKEFRAQCDGEWRELLRGEQSARIAAQRQERARPLLATFQEWLEAEKPSLLPQHAVRGAMEYLLNHWAAFCRYTDDGRLDIDNNEAERAMKHLAIGRKNWLFCGSERGARAAAIHFSLIATCRQHNVQPWTYLRDLLVRLPLLREAGQLTPEHLRSFLPHLWRPAPE